MHAQTAHHLDHGHRREGERNEEQAVLDGAVTQRIWLDGSMNDTLNDSMPLPSTLSPVPRAAPRM